MRLYFNIQKQINSPKAAIKIAENFCKKYFNSSAIDLLVSEYFNTGAYQKGLQASRDRIEKTPYAIGYIYRSAQINNVASNYSEALNALNRAKKLSPYIYYLYDSEGNIYKNLKNTAKAKEAFQKAIYYRPTAYESRTQLRLLENKPEIFDLFPAFNLDSLIAAAPGAKDYPEENSLIVLYDSRIVFYPEGAQEINEKLAIKILNQSGIERWKDYSIGHTGSQKLQLDKYEVIKANGQKIKAETDNNGRVVFTNLEVGDVLYLDFRLQNHYSGILSEHFYGQMLMQYNLPSMMIRQAILLHKDKKFDHQMTHADLKPTITDVEDMKLYQWVYANQPAIKSEPLISPFVDIAPCLTFSSIPHWQCVADWYKELTANKFGENSDYIL
jgi:tetratricopeptide (TPR) repeat protein